MRPKNSELKIFFIVMVLLGTFSAHAQFDFNMHDSARFTRSLVDITVDTTGKIPKFGPNRLFFVHGLCQLGEKSGPQVYGLQTNWWSGSIEYGVRGKLKLWSWEALVMDAGYRYDRYSMRKDTPKLIPLDPTIHQRERISDHNFSGSFCDRINFGKRGNVMGSWLDFGVYADWSFRTSNVYVDQHYDSNSPSGYRYKNKTKITRLPYMEKTNYGLTVRFGGDYGGVFAEWRMNNIIKKNYTTGDRDLPKLTIGIEFYMWDY
jgi:hypothetical protein